MSGLVSGIVGTQTLPAQPCVLAVNTARDSSVTGDGSVVTVDYDGEVFDQGQNFAADTFTAPITGRYLVCVGVMFTGPAAETLEPLSGKIVASNRTVRLIHESWLSTNERDRIWINASRIIDMDAADTFTITVYIDGMSKAVHIEGSADSDCHTSLSIALLA